MVGSFMVHMMEVASMNSHEIGRVEAGPGESWMVGQTRPIGCALEPTLVLLNHSCDPSMLRVNTGSSTLGYASRDIKVGEEITDCYCFTYDITPEEERRPQLDRKYKFSCQCRACSQHWDTYQLLPKSFNDLSPHQLKIDPSDLQSVQANMKTIMQLGAKINQLQKSEDYEGALQLYGKFHRSLAEVVEPPHQFYVMSRRSLATSLWLLHGNKKRN